MCMFNELENSRQISCRSYEQELHGVNLKHNTTLAIRNDFLSQSRFNVHLFLMVSRNPEYLHNSEDEFADFSDTPQKGYDEI